MKFVLQSIGSLLYILYRVITLPFFMLGYSLWAACRVVQMVWAGIGAVRHSVYNGIENLKPVLKSSLQISRRLFHWFPNH